MPRVSVIIATYNWSRALRCAIQSVLQQSFADFELLVIGDGCTDDSAQVAASFEDSRIHWRNLPANTGTQTAPNNAGLALARGELIAYLGHDDLWFPDHLAALCIALDQSGADLAYSLMALLGPPGSGIGALSGLDALADPEFPQVIPPSSILHRRALIDRIGAWRDYREIEFPHDYEFVLRAWRDRQCFACSQRLSAIKLPAAWRPGVYRAARADEQEELLHSIQTEPDLRERLLIDLVAAYAAGRAIRLDPPPRGETLPVIERNREYKGSMPVEQPRRENLRFAFDQELPGYEWHGVESDPRQGTFQWSGPATRSTLQFWLAAHDMRVRFRILMALAPDILDSLRLSVNDWPIELARQADVEGAWLFEGRIPADALAAAPAILCFTIARTIAPSTLDPPSADRRPLGLAFNWIEIGSEQDARGTMAL